MLSFAVNCSMSYLISKITIPKGSLIIFLELHDSINHWVTIIDKIALIRTKCQGF